MKAHLKNNIPEHVPREEGARFPLDGIRIIDFSHYIAGPFATMILASMGADVIKVESPGKGDDFRQYPPIQETLGGGAPFSWCNRNKRGIALDLKSVEGRSDALHLISQADILVENFSTGVMDRLGLSYASCSKLNPRLIYCSISAYGRKGQFADRSGFDPISQAESGFISMNGYPDRDGVRSLSPVMDIGTALMASNAILGALMARSNSQEGQLVEIALFDTAVMMTGYAPLQYLYTENEPQRWGNISPDTCPSGLFYANDYSFLINCGSTEIFNRLVNDVLQLPELSSNPDYATNADRISRRDQLFKLIQSEFGKKSWSYWKSRLRKFGIPSGEVRTVSQMIQSEECQDRKLITRFRDERVGWIYNMNLPIRYSATPLADPTVAPTIGQHTTEILTEWLKH